MEARPTTQQAAQFLGGALLVLGVLGFVPGVTEHDGGLAYAGHSARADLFGVFRVSVLHNLLHVAAGLAGLALGRSQRRARRFLLGGGFVFLALWLYGMLVGNGSANFIPLNEADDWLHLAIGLTLLASGAATSGRRPAAVPTA